LQLLHIMGMQAVHGEASAVAASSTVRVLVNAAGVDRLTSEMLLDRACGATTVCIDLLDCGKAVVGL
jgi:hypothetical protein